MKIFGAEAPRGSHFPRGRGGAGRASLTSTTVLSSGYHRGRSGGSSNGGVFYHQDVAVMVEVVEVDSVVVVIVVSCHQHSHAQHLALSTRCFVDPQYEPTG